MYNQRFSHSNILILFLKFVSCFQRLGGVCQEGKRREERRDRGHQRGSEVGKRKTDQGSSSSQGQDGTRKQGNAGGNDNHKKKLFFCFSPIPWVLNIFI